MPKFERLLLSGNEAVALAAKHSGVKMGTGYPGTPSTEILETLAGFGNQSILTRWAPNEKVALEVGLGAAFAGARALVTMKHVGLNVAADPFFTGAYIGAAGLVLACAEDPGMHSSQNEQDNRFFAKSGKVPVLEPSSSQEAYDFARRAFGLSEEFETVVILRLTTRVCHGKGLVQPSAPDAAERTCRFEKDPARWVMVPAHARRRHVVLEEKMKRLRERSEASELNRAVNGQEGAPVGVVASGVAFQYVREVAPDVPVFKVGMSWPLPVDAIASFAKTVGELVVVEELEDFMLEAILAAGIPARGKDASFRTGELSPDAARLILAGKPKPAAVQRDDLPPPRPPVLCPGCGHRSVFSILKKMGVVVTGDIGCYTLGALPPLASLDTCVCMGGGVSVALGLERVLPEDEARRVVGVVGDSTFFHSGLTGVLDAVYNGSRGTLLILDNRTTAMTGGQDHPGTGQRLDGGAAPEVDAAEACRGLGVKDVKVVDAYDRKGFQEALADSMERDEYSVIVVRRPCLLLDRSAQRPKFAIDPEVCSNCGACLRVGCPALKQAEGHVEINRILCNGCGLCFEVCKFDAVSPAQ